MKKTLKIRGLGWLLVVALGVCGTMKKMKEEERVERSLEFGERLVLNEDMRFGSRWLSGAWSTGSDLVTAVIESDSVIAFDPSAGFELSGGRVLYKQAREGFASQSASGDLVMERSADSVAERDVKEEVHLRSAASDQEREGTSGWFWTLPLLVGAVGISLFVLRKLKWN